MRSLSLCPWRARCARHPFLVPGVLLALWLLATIGVRPLAMPDEGRYGSVALHMLLSGDWITPRLDGMPFFHKPPLYCWLAAGAMQLLGAAPWVARLPAALPATPYARFGEIPMLVLLTALAAAVLQPRKRHKP